MPITIHVPLRVEKGERRNSLCPVRLVSLEILPKRRHRVSRLIGEGVQGKEPVHLDPVVLSKTNAVCLHLAHRFVADLLSRLGLAFSLGLEIKQHELAVQLDQGIQSTGEWYCSFIAAHLMLRADHVIKVLPER